MAGLHLLSDEGFRTDGRRPNELRRLRCQIGVFKQADGSAYFEMGNTKVLAAVYGPHQVHGSKAKALYDRALINCQYSMAVFSGVERKQRPRGDRKSVEMTEHLQQAFEATIFTHLYPRAQIDIFVEVLQSDGSNYCGCLNAAMLALVDASIPVRDLVCACSAGLADNRPITDMNYVEESQGRPELMITLLPKSSKIVGLSLNGRLHDNYWDTVMEAAVKGCNDIFSFMNKSVREHMVDLSASLGCADD